MTDGQTFLRNPATFSITDEEFASILPFGSTIISVFRSKPDLLEYPYRLRGLHSQKYYKFAIDVSADENEVITSFYKSGLDLDAVKAEGKDSIWYDVVFPGPPSETICVDAWRAINVRSHAIIDLLIYYVFLANVYVPNAGLIKNLYSANVEVDALGRTSEDHAAQAVVRIIKRYVQYQGLEQQHARHILMMMKHQNDPKARMQAPRGISFERECMQALTDAGFDVRVTPASGDFGADLIAEKDKLGFAIQCKDTSKPVGVKAVQEAVAARSHYRTDFAVVCSTARFTDAAVELATSNNVILSKLANIVSVLEAV